MNQSTTRGHANRDYFCLAGIGIRAGYPSAALLRHVPRRERAHVANRVVLALTSNPYYALRGVRPDTTELSAVAKRLGVGRAYRIGKNTWYLVSNGKQRGVFKVQHGLIEEVGLMDSRLARNRASARRLLASFH